MDRMGLCMGCHKEMTNPKVWQAVSTPGTLNNVQHIDLMHKMLIEYMKSKQKGQ